MKINSSVLQKELDNIINDVQTINNRPIDFAYISIGSKFNQEVVNMKNNRVLTNAGYQMIPQFLRNPHEDTYKYVIIVDHFNKEDEKINKSILLRDTILNIRLFVINFRIDYKNQDLLVKFLKSLTIIFSFLKNKQFIICNYIKYLNQPNKMELESQENIDTIIKSSINETEFKDCYYEWFGYNDCLYNYIFNKRYFCNNLNYYKNVKKIEDLVLNDIINTESEELSKFVFDITEFNSTFHIGPSSLHDILFI